MRNVLVNCDLCVCQQTRLQLSVCIMRLIHRANLFVRLVPYVWSIPNGYICLLFMFSSSIMSCILNYRRDELVVVYSHAAKLVRPLKSVVLIDHRMWVFKKFNLLVQLISLVKNWDTLSMYYSYISRNQHINSNKFSQITCRSRNYTISLKY